uniref:Uncharacterized protein n=1 Tax=Cacopsylla melanoneura TaxID=428564 RepID=A0A8D9BLD2_9HEMI
MKMGFSTAQRNLSLSLCPLQTTGSKINLAFYVLFTPTFTFTTNFCEMATFVHGNLQPPKFIVFFYVFLQTIFSTKIFVKWLLLSIANYRLRNLWFFFPCFIPNDFYHLNFCEHNCFCPLHTIQHCILYTLKLTRGRVFS